MALRILAIVNAKLADKATLLGAVLDALERTKASIRAKGEHAFGVLKCVFGYRRVKYRGMAKNTANLMVLFALLQPVHGAQATAAGVSAPKGGAAAHEQGRNGPPTDHNRPWSASRCHHVKHQPPTTVSEAVVQAFPNQVAS